MPSPRKGQLERLDRRVVLVGLGNIGSGLAPVLARLGVKAIDLVDPDVYEEKNLAGQDIIARDVGQPKAVVQARRLRRINPALDVRAYCSRIEALPMGLLWSADLVASCLDSRVSRQYVNQAAWHLGVPLVDGAVDASNLLARVNVYVPGPESSCMECGWDDDDYDVAAMEQRYPCQKGGGGLAPTNAPASLGLIAAGVMGTECQKLLADDRAHLLADRQVMLNLRHHTHVLTTFRRTHCRFDHEIWQIEQIESPPSTLTIGEIAHFVGNSPGHSSGCALRIEGQHFTTMQSCPGCGHHERVPLHLAQRVSSARRRCRVCRQRMAVRGFDLREWIDCQAIGEHDRARPLSSFGVKPFDVLSVRNGDRRRHFVLAPSTVSRVTTKWGCDRRPLAKASQGDEP